MKSKIIRFPEIKKRILIVNCFFDEMRFKVGRNTQIPQAMGPVYLAGAFAEKIEDLRMHYTIGNFDFLKAVHNIAVLCG